MQNLPVPALALLALAAATPDAPAQCPTWSDEFVFEGFNGNVHVSGALGSELFAGGWFSKVGQIVSNGHVARFDGQRWHDAGAGIADSQPDYTDMQAFDAGAGPVLYLTGNFTGVGFSDFGQWNGSAWTAVPGAPANPGAMEVFDDGTGPALFVSASGSIHRFDGTTWTVVGTSGANDLVVFDDGNGPALYACGSFSDMSGVPADGVARFDGNAWSALGPGIPSTGSPSSYVFELAAFDDGTGPLLVAGGQFQLAGGVTVDNFAAWDGGSWSAMGGSGGKLVWGLHTYDSGAGQHLFATTSILGDDPLLTWNGSAWVDVPGWTKTSGNSLSALTFTDYDDGSGPRMFLGGNFAYVGEAWAERAAFFDGSGWAPASYGQGLQGRAETFLTFDDGSGPSLYVGGYYVGAGQLATEGIARWDGSAWQPVGEGLQSVVFDLASFDDGSGPALYAGGNINSSGGVIIADVARWDGTLWHGVGSGFAGNVHALATFDDGDGEELYAGGTFTSAGGAPASRIAKWDGASWSEVGGGVDMAVNDLLVWDDGSGPSLFAGGAFTTAGGQAASMVARWDGASWSPVGTGLSGGLEDMSVSALTLFDLGAGTVLIAGGDFTLAGVTPLGHVAAWDGAAWTDVGGGFDQGQVLALAVHPAGGGDALWAGGTFSTSGGQPTDNLAQLVNGAWVASPAGSPDFWVRALATEPPSAGAPQGLFVGGSFDMVGTTSSEFVARLDDPCTCSVVNYCTAGTSASGCQALITASGVPSATLSSGFTLAIQDMEGDKNGLFFYGTNGKQANPWGNGTSYVCVVPPRVRGGLLTGVGTPGACDGAFAQDLNARWCVTCPKPAHNPGAGAVMQAQFWYRDPQNTSNQSSSMSDAVEFTVCP